MTSIKHPITEHKSEPLYQALERLRRVLYEGDIDMQTPPQETEMYAALEELSECLAAPIWGLLRGWKRDAKLYKEALETIREIALAQCDTVFFDISDAALKHEDRSHD